MQYRALGLFQNIVGCRYNAVQYDMILYTALQLARQNINQGKNPQKTPHSSPIRANYGVTFVRISKKIDVITEPHRSHPFSV